MIITQVEARDLPEAWFLCLKKLSDYPIWSMPVGIHQYTIDRGSFKGQQRREFDFVNIHVKYPGSRPLVPETPQGIPQPCTQEYVYGYLRYLITGDREENEDYTYGQDLEKQIPLVIDMYRRDGFNTNQAFMAVGNCDSIGKNDPQCLRMIDTRVETHKYGPPTLNFVVYFRSWDLWGGLPANLAGIQMLKEYMANEIGVEDGELIAISKGLHLYEYAWELADKIINR